MNSFTNMGCMTPSLRNRLAPMAAFVMKTMCRRGTHRDRLSEYIARVTQPATEPFGIGPAGVLHRDANGHGRPARGRAGRDG